MNFVEVTILCLLFICVNHTSAAGDGSCINITLPNVLGLGECLGENQNLCIQDSDGALIELGDVVLCALKGIRDFNLGSQLYIIVQLLDYGFQRNNLGIVTDAIRGVCQLTAIVFRWNCDVLTVDTDAVCADPIQINLPSVLGAGKCLGTEFQTCENGQQVTGSVVQVLFNVIQCLLENLSEENLSTLLSNTICSVLQIIEDIIGKNVVTIPIIAAINGLLQTNCAAASP